LLPCRYLQGGTVHGWLNVEGKSHELPIGLLLQHFEPNGSLVGGLEHFLFFHILGIIIPTDFHIFQDG